ncbi:MAG: gliding motility-associated C-terminal domain-containing protein, partial [Chitinophagaceae bacterium]
LKAPVGYTYAWQPSGSGNSYITVRDDGHYSCTISNRCGASTAGITLSHLELPLVGVGIYGDSTLCKDEMLVPAILYNHSAFSKLWSTNDTGSEITVHLPGLYTLTTYNVCGTHEESLYLHGCKGIMAFPNAFSPNGDGRNDVFRPIVQDGTFIEYYVMKIFNRWGQQVFISFKADYGWDGGQNEVGSYFYLCKFKEYGQGEQFIRGDLELLK